MPKPTILVTNDDGIESPGLLAAAEAALPLGNVVIAAPSKQQTGMSRSLHGDREACLVKKDYIINGRSIPAFHCDASPALVVQHTLAVLFPQRLPDLLISGINYGENLGINVSLSGTLGAALQAASMGIPAIVASLQTEIQDHYVYSDLVWETAVYFVNKFGQNAVNQSWPFDVDVLKIDVPQQATSKTPWRVTRLARQAYFRTVIENPSLKSKLGDAYLEFAALDDSLPTDSDIYAFEVDQVVSVTPISLDFTARVDFSVLQQVLDGKTAI